MKKKLEEINNKPILHWTDWTLIGLAVTLIFWGLLTLYLIPNAPH